VLHCLRSFPFLWCFWCVMLAKSCPEFGLSRLVGAHSCTVALALCLVATNWVPFWHLQDPSPTCGAAPEAGPTCNTPAPFNEWFAAQVGITHLPVWCWYPACVSVSILINQHYQHIWNSDNSHVRLYLNCHSVEVTFQLLFSCQVHYLSWWQCQLLACHHLAS